ncbi:MAG: NAD-dependent epimerase/dehydratase family protein [Bacteroidales bacterium]|nr:NAD-dependent epimerase/dehydratase family protein [Bacteroidales bacterium]
MSRTIYLVTGAAGFLGSNVCAQLLERGEKVRAFVLEGDKSAKYIPSEVEIFYGDLCDKESLKDFFTVENGDETVCIHVASMVTVNPNYRKIVLDVNVGGTENIIDMCLEHPECRKMVYVSSTGAIPELPHGQKIKEVDEFDLDKVMGWYSKSKAMATNNVFTAVKKRGLKATVVYPTGIFGPNDPAVSETTSTIIKIIKGEMPVGINGSFNIVDVRDLAAGCIAAADKGRIGEGYILGNEVVKFKTLSKILCDELGCPPVKFFLPLNLAERIASRMEKKAAKTGEMPMMTTFSVYNLKRNNRFDYSKAERELGYTTRPLEETLRDEAKWLKENGLI